MKKNVMMRVASIMLVLVLMTSSVISGTFAKYVTEGSASAEARVAKWGVEFVTTSDDMFKTNYAYETQPNNVVGTYSVLATTDVVAPGTEGNGYTFTTAHPMGDPEVSYVVTFKPAAGYETIYVDGYYPVKFTVDLDTYTLSTNNLDDVMTAVENLQYMYDVTEKQYYISEDAGTTWTNVGNTAPTLELSWQWLFYVDDATDVLDTQLGNLAAGYTAAQVGATNYNLDIAYSITATATQID